MWARFFPVLGYFERFNFHFFIAVVAGKEIFQLQLQFEILTECYKASEIHLLSTFAKI